VVNRGKKCSLQKQKQEDLALVLSALLRDTKYQQLLVCDLIDHVGDRTVGLDIGHLTDENIVSPTTVIQ